MSQLFETIKCCDGRLFHLEYHQARLNRSRKEYFGADTAIDLHSLIQIPHFAQKGLFRCRVIYNKDVVNVEFVSHQYRKIQSLRLVYDNQIDYSYKYCDRSSIEKLLEQRESCDDILIVRNNLITDSSTANVVFYDGTRWWTPDTPLLNGTQRSRLLDTGAVSMRRITPTDLHKFVSVALINAMQELNSTPAIPVLHIIL